MRCPNLEALEFCHEREFNLRKLMSVVCNDGVFPKLKSFSLASAHDIPREYLTPFATTMQGRIKTFTSYSISSSSINVLISSGWADTLEVIRLQHLPSKDISRILGTCSNLRTFSVSRNGLTTLYSGEQDDREAEWVCLDLENFEMTYLDGRPSTKRGDNGSDITATTVSDRSLKEERTVECIKRVYRQLGRLKRLQHLRIGWRTSADFEQCANLDLSFKSGLRHLKTLKELRVLDVGCIQQLNIGFEEVEWIAESWPELQLIKGYYAKETTDRVRVDGFEIIDEDIVDAKWNGMKDPVHIDWLRSLRPDILIT
ncbi:hypothetical protein BGX26_005618 [Mortierella sp. AD094]|nr:hypothetical protein BGX26_005618 [Mortierella sp. AD094]